MIITRDEGLIRHLERRADPERVSLRFARSGYEGSAIISTFSPAVIFMDSDLAEVRTGFLPDSILKDERIPAVRPVVAYRDGHEGLFDGLPMLAIPAPFSADEVERIAAEVARPRTNTPRDVA
ncbi:MAG: hypothetical protein MUO50_08750 [Longimicrobiales bacterium]|nr:hypothetical protein [Longimicrobiales bacterium]